MDGARVAESHQRADGHRVQCIETCVVQTTTTAGPVTCGCPLMLRHVFLVIWVAAELLRHSHLQIHLSRALS